MTLTRVNVETILVSRRGPLMTAAGMAVTYAGSNADLNDPIGYGIRRLGGSTTDYTSVTDADIAGVDASDYDALLDLSELRLLRNIKGNLDDVDTTSGPFTEKYSQLMQSVKDDIDALNQKIQAEYSIGGPTIQTGVIQMDFADHNETITDGSGSE